MTTKQPQQPPKDLPVKPKNVPPPPPPKVYLERSIKNARPIAKSKRTDHD